MKIKLIEEWKVAHKYWTTRIFAIVLLFPDIYSGIVALGWSEELPEPAKWTLRAIGAIGLVARHIKQSFDKMKDGENEPS